MSAPHNNIPVSNSLCFKGYESSSGRSQGYGLDEINNTRPRNSNTNSQIINVDTLAQKLIKMSRKKKASISSVPTRKRKYETTASMELVVNEDSDIGRPAKIRKILPGNTPPTQMFPSAGITESAHSDAAGADFSHTDDPTYDDAAASIPTIAITLWSSSETESSDSLASDAEKSDIEMHYPESITTGSTNVLNKGSFSSKSPKISHVTTSEAPIHNNEASKTASSKKRKLDTQASKPITIQKSRQAPEESKAVTTKKRRHDDNTSNSSTTVAFKKPRPDTSSSASVAFHVPSQHVETPDADSSDSESTDFEKDLIRNFEQLTLMRASKSRRHPNQDPYDRQYDRKSYQ